MNTNKTLLALAILVSFIIGVFFGRTFFPVQEKKPINDVPMVETKTDSTEVAVVAKDTLPPPKEEEKPTVATSELPSSSGCFTNEKDLSLHLSLFAEDLESQQLPYNNKEPEKLLDCSGITHRTFKHISSKCDSYQYPDVKTTRDTRMMSKWFNQNNNLVIIDDPMSKRNLIKPGSVMFFGGSGKVYNDLAVDRVTAQRPKGIIEHVGVVTEVQRDESGDVTGYVMFHGRRPGKHAQRSHYHSVKPPRIGYPILGNWNQQWVAVANIMTPK